MPIQEEIASHKKQGLLLQKYKEDANKFWNEILEYCNSKLEYNRSCDELYNLRGMCYYHTNKHGEAIIDYTRAIELDEHRQVTVPDKYISHANKAEYHFNRSLAYNAAGQIFKAMRDCIMAIEIDENNPEYKQKLKALAERVK